jgi:hypothetical protein
MAASLRACGDVELGAQPLALDVDALWLRMLRTLGSDVDESSDVA